MKGSLLTPVLSGLSCVLSQALPGKPRCTREVGAHFTADQPLPGSEGQFAHIWTGKARFSAAVRMEPASFLGK